MTQTIKITGENVNQRLDKYLTEQWPEKSRSQIQKLIKSGGVLVNGEMSSVHHFLKEKDEITVQEQPAKLDQPTHKQTNAQVGQHKQLQEPSIVSETADYIVLHKPAGLLVHEGAGEHEPTLVDWLLKKYPAIAKIGEDPVRPGIVHRLDREVSGLMVVAKTQAMFDRLKEQFQNRTVKKEYTALVNGRPAKEEDEIIFNIDRSETTDYKMAAVPTSGSDDRGRHAVTAFEVMKRYAKYTLLKIQPRTGRTHQIRVHLNAYGLPIAGDLVYCPTKLRAKNHLPSNRIFLQATRLSFTDLANQWQKFSEPLDKELNDFLETSKGKA